MSITVSQIDKQLLPQLEAGALNSVILLNGNELLLVEEALDQLRALLRPFGFTERLGHTADSSFDWSVLSGGGQSMSLFASRQLIEVRVPKSLGAVGTKALVEASQVASDNVVLVIMPQLERKQRQAKWYKALEQSATVIDVHDVPVEQYSGWIRHRLQTRGLRVEAGVIETLTAMTEGNLLAAAQEIDKLKVLANESGVTLELLNQSLADHARYDVFALCDACLAGDVLHAQRMIERLASEGVEPVIAVWAIAKDVRALLSIQQSTSRGISFANSCQQVQVWQKRQGIFQSALSRLDHDQLTELMLRVVSLDQSIKGQATYQACGDAWFQIKQVALALAGANVCFNSGTSSKAA